MIGPQERLRQSYAGERMVGVSIEVPSSGRYLIRASVWDGTRSESVTVGLDCEDSELEGEADAVLAALVEQTLPGSTIQRVWPPSDHS